MAHGTDLRPSFDAVVKMIEAMILELCPQIADYDADVERKYREEQERRRKERELEEEQRRQEKEEKKRNKYACRVSCVSCVVCRVCRVSCVVCDRARVLLADAQVVGAGSC
jgi:hypothetical protein